MQNILNFENVSKKYGDLDALNEIQFTIPENSIFAILGPNGSGKSTLIKILAGLITSWNGNILYKYWHKAFYRSCFFSKNYATIYSFSFRISVFKWLV